MAYELTDPADVIVVQKGLFSAVPFVMKANGDGRAGVVDWAHDDATGYLFHMQAKSNTGALAAIVALGTDAGSGIGLLLSHKNSGNGLRLIHQPGASIGAYLSSYSVNAAFLAEIHKGAGEVRITPKVGQGINDGVTTQGSTTFTSASAAFTVADNGASLLQLTSRGLNDPSGSIPTGTTITYVNSTTVTMSQPAAASATGLLALIGGRAVATDQVLFRGQDEAAGTLWSFRKGDAFFRVPLNIRSNAAATPTLVALQASGQTSSIIDIADTAGTTIFSRFDKSGYFMTRKTAAPADADLVAGEMAIWFDATNGVAKLMVKAKEAGGTVRTAAVLLA